MRKRITLTTENTQLLTILLLGFSSGLPFLLTLSTLSYWLAESGISKTAIGVFMLISLPYSLKFLWAPLIDHIRIPYFSHKFGLRRSWAITSQIFLMISLLFLGFCDPSHSIIQTAICAFCVAFFSATQDIVIDAYRIEIIQEKNQGMGAALESIGFRFGMLASGAGALYLAHLFSWQTSYMIMALFVLCGIGTVLLMPEPKHTGEKVIKLPSRPASTSQQFRRLFLLPLEHFKNNPNFFTLLLFILCFKMGDTVLNAMSAPFLCDLGVSKIEFAQISKVFGITLMVIGGLTGGLAVRQLGMMQSVVFSLILQSASCLMFLIQSLVGYDLSVLMVTVGFESFCSGVVCAVFIAYLSSLCQQPFTATYFTLLYSVGSFSRVVTSVAAGWLADNIGWSALFFMSSLLVIPSLFIFARLRQVPVEAEKSSRIQAKIS